MKELHQMWTHKIFRDVHHNSSTVEDEERVQPILLFLTMKRYGHIKERACVDERKQQIWIFKEDLSSPTVVPEALFYKLVVDTLKKWDVITCDLPGYLIQTDIDERLVLRVNTALDKLLVEVDPKRCKKLLRWECGRLVIYMPCS